MKTSKYISYIVLSTLVLSLASCEPNAIEQNNIFMPSDTTEAGEANLHQWLDENNPEGWKIFTLDDFVDTFMTEEGNFLSDTCPYRTRSTNGNGIYLFSVDTLPTNGRGIYIRGRVTTDDYAGNFYKAMVIQQIVNGEQQNLRISVDIGSSGGLFQLGQEIIIRCNGFAVGRYANQPQLCVPAYNDNAYANKANEKVGWAPGRIQGSKFRLATKLIGTPDPSLLQYDEITLDELFDKIPRKPAMTKEDMKKVRHFDGRLVRLQKVHFSGEYYTQDGELVNCVYQHPDSSEYANVFAPTTQNVGYPQSRVLFNKSNNKDKAICCSCSEYAKFAYFFIPGAQEDSVKAVTNCKRWEGTVAGIVGWYADNAAYIPPKSDLKGSEWSVTPRGIPGIGIPDIQLKSNFPMPGIPIGTEWVPQEFDPVFYLDYYYPQKNDSGSDE
ncbi:MAG: hypothetical protein IJR42_01755 [Paludibacteraceae bacterium]|nr:hypothetical protein [Paludibacteraceae bacterium]